MDHNKFSEEFNKELRNLNTAEILELSQFERNFNNYTLNIKDRVNMMESILNNYSKKSNKREENLNILDNYDLGFEVSQKLTDYLVSKKTEKLNTEIYKDRNHLQKNMQEFAKELIKIEANQAKQKRLIFFLSNALRIINQQWKKRKVQDKIIQVDIKEINPLSKYKIEIAINKYL